MEEEILQKIKPGDILDIGDGYLGIVLADNIVQKLYITPPVFSLAGYSILGLDFVAIIEAIYRPKVDFDTWNISNYKKHSTLVLDCRSKEMTVEQISKELGYKVKVI